MVEIEDEVILIAASRGQKNELVDFQEEKKPQILELNSNLKKTVALELTKTRL
jgi:hypothetical protein